MVERSLIWSSESLSVFDGFSAFCGDEGVDVAVAAGAVFCSCFGVDDFVLLFATTTFLGGTTNFCGFAIRIGFFFCADCVRSFGVLFVGNDDDLNLIDVVRNIGETQVSDALTRENERYFRSIFR